MTMSTETTPPALFGFDLLRLVSFRLWPLGFDLAILPRWLLALEVTPYSRGRVVWGQVAGRGMIGTMEEPRPKGSPALPFFECRVEEDARHLFVGRFHLVVDRKRTRAARRAARGPIVGVNL